jgi:integrase
MHLTDIKINNTKPGDKARKLFDGNGLFLQVNPTGSKLWRMKYRYRGKEKLLSFGPYPEVALRDARDKRKEARALLRDDRDPSQVKKEKRRIAELEATSSFGVIADEYLEKLRREEKSEATLTKTAWLMDMAKREFGNRPITEIGARDILVPLKKLEADGKYETAHRLRSTIGRVCRYAIATARAETDPTYALQGALVVHKVRSRSAITDEKTLGELLRDIRQYDGYRVISIGLELLAMLAQRPGELRKAQWDEFDFEKAEWNIPADRMKMRRPHKVPLSKQAMELLRELQGYSSFNDWVLPSISSPRKPISDNTMNQALRRMDYSNDQHTSHGFRATYATLANESGLWNPDAIERQLAHVDANSVRRVYSRGSFWEERVRMTQWWADKLDEWRISNV